MAKKDSDRDDPRLENEQGISRRDFVKTGTAAGLGAGALLTPDPARAQAPAAGADVVWDYEVDVVIAGGGCAGLTAAIRARDLGASVLVVDANYDVGGRMLHSGSYVSLGGGDPAQRRDMKGEKDKEGFISVDPAEAPEELDDSVELLFTDITDWSVVDPKASEPVPLQRAGARARVGREQPRPRGSSSWTTTSASRASAARTAAAACPARAGRAASSCSATART